MGKRFGHHMAGWFVLGGREPLYYSGLTSALVMLAKLHGLRIPNPTLLPPNDFSPAAVMASRFRAAGTPCLVSGPVSALVRVASAAMEGRLDIRGTLFLASGETLTEPKRAVIESSGGEVFTRYAASEVGIIGHGCRSMTRGDCVHLYSDGLAAINHKRVAPLSDVEVQSILFTTLLPYAPNVVVNLETDDNGIVETAYCDCAFSRLGLTTQIRDIFSFGKLTGQGMTLVGTDLLRLLEEILPARLGGRPGDYQLVERESAGQTQLTLRVSPRVKLSTADKARQCFLEEIRQFYGGALASRVWLHTEGLDVVVLEPFAGATGKVNPLHLLNLGAQATHAS
ncbi:MAG: hypothetical protein ABIZ80_19400 [Bryobacteraceae bacterium]